MKLNIEFSSVSVGKLEDTDTKPSNGSVGVSSQSV